MTAFHRILCPVDFSECSRHALHLAGAIARASGATVTALHAVHPIPYADPLMGGAIVFTPDDLDRIGRDLARFVGDELPGVPVATDVVQGSAVDVILSEARSMPADLIVLGTHGRSGFEAFMLGSVTERVLRRAPCPVLTVPPRMSDAVPLAPTMFQRVLCALDFSPASVKALEVASALTRASRAMLTVLHVLEPQSVFEPVMVAGPGGTSDAARAVACEQLHDLVPRDLSAHEVVAQGKAYREVLDRARRDGSDLIVIGVHSGLADRLGFLGATTNHIVREATCPVLSVRA